MISPARRAALHDIHVAGALLLLGLAIVVRAEQPLRAAAQTSSDGWQIARDAVDLVNPIADTPEALRKGRQLYESKCQRCHGRGGRGNGPDADPDDPPADLTDARRASRNPDGVMFYKIWNGRSKPRMPALKTDASREDAWTLVLYVKTLRVP